MGTPRRARSTHARPDASTYLELERSPHSTPLHHHGGEETGGEKTRDEEETSRQEIRQEARHQARHRGEEDDGDEEEAGGEEETRGEEETGRQEEAGGEEEAGGQEAESQGVQKVRGLSSHGSGARRARFRTRGGGDDYRERRFVSWV